MYDAIIIGAGPAGLSAGIYLARFRRNVLIIDAEQGRSMIPGTYHNLPGFSEPIERRELRKLGAEQAQRYGAEKICNEVRDIHMISPDNFEVICEENTFMTKNLIFCTGVLDIWPEIDEYESYLGYTLHSCPICAGFESIDKKLILIGYDERVTKLAMEMLGYTEKIVIITNGLPLSVKQCYLDKVRNANIAVYMNRLVKLIGQDGWIEKVVLDNGNEIETDIIYSRLGVRINSQLAQKIGVNVDGCGYIVVDQEQKTNLKNVYAAGDVTTFDHKQVVTAMYEGFVAGLSIHSSLLKKEIEKY